MKSTYAEGPFYSITLDDGVATCRVWGNPDLDWAEGARWAHEIAKALLTLAAGPRESARALLFDDREAPPVVGPRTQTSLGTFLSAWERRGRRVAFVLDASPVRGLQARRLLAEWAPKHGRAFTSIEEARAWVLARDADSPGPTKPSPR
ncbi:MAG TPA: hypothetical protein VFS43_17160 [Polyangiaceae bacterium]|nr:hypothetical protein [Polyangiaceae bacterium]